MYFGGNWEKNLKGLIEAQKEAQKKYGREHLVISGPNKGSTITLTFYTPPKQSQPKVSEMK